MRIVPICFCLLVLAASVNGQAFGSCESALQPIFAAAIGYRCVQLTISSTNFNTSTVSYSQGNLYYNRYYDGLPNRDVPSFPIITNQALSCAQGRNQPFSVEDIDSYIARNYFDVLVTRDGTLRLAVGSGEYVNVTLSCLNSQLPAVGHDQQGNIYSVQLVALDITQGCPTDTVGTACNTSLTAPACLPPCGSSQACTVDDFGYGRCSNINLEPPAPQPSIPANPSPSPLNASPSPSSTSICATMSLAQCQNAYSQGCQVWYAQGCCGDTLAYCAPSSCSSRSLSCARNPANGRAYEVTNGCAPYGFSNFTAPPPSDCSAVSCPSGSYCTILPSTCSQTSCCPPQAACVSN